MKLIKTSFEPTACVRLRLVIPLVRIALKSGEPFTLLANLGLIAT